MHLPQQRRTELLDKLVEAEGFATVEAMLEAVVFDSVSPAICKVCELTCEMEPDQTRGWCENCSANTVVAAPFLAGII